MTAVAELDGVTKVYRVRGGTRERHVAVDNVSFSVDAGETLGIVGESGSGKTTLARMMLRLTRPTSGRVSITGIDIWAASRTTRKQLPRAVQVVFQDPYSSLDPRMKVGASITEGAKRVFGHQSAASELGRLLDIVGLPQRYQNLYPASCRGASAKESLSPGRLRCSRRCS